MDAPQPPQQLSLAAEDGGGDDSIPFAQLGHAHHVSQARPIVLTVVGILSLVFAVFGGLVCLWGFAMSAGALAISNIPPTAFAPQGAVGALNLSNQVTVLNTLSSIHPLSAAQRQSLNNYLLTQGETAFPSNGRALSPAAIRVAVLKTSTQQNPGLTPPGSAAEVVFTLATGELHVADGQTSFADTLSYPAIATPNSIGTGAPAPAPAWLNTNATNVGQALISNVQAQIAPKNLTPPQFQMLKAQFLPGAVNPVYLPTNPTLQSATVTGTGDLIIVWNDVGGMKSMVIDPRGTTTGPNYGNNPAAMFAQKVSPGMLRNVFIALGANTLLMPYLLIIGIMAAAGSRRVRRPHLVYAQLQIPLAVFGAIEMVHLFAIFSRAAAANSTAQTTLYTIVIALFACAYPISLLFIMNTQTVRRYAAAT